MNTPLGLMRPTRLPFGLKISPNLWQRTMDEVLKGLNGVACYLDDILVTGRTREEHQANLDAVMQRLQERGLRLRKEKCELFRKTIIYLGHEISQDGLRPTDERNVPADVLSRLPSRTESDDGTWQVCSAEEEELICATIEDDILPVTADQVARQTARDPVLGPVLSWVRSGAWPKKTEAKFQPYIRCRDGLTVVDGCLQVGEKVVIPSRFRRQLLEELHEGHLGVCKMKSLARGFVWWPHLDDEIEQLCQQCGPCRTNAQRPATSAVHPWVYPSAPWERVHIDFASHQGRDYLVLVDAFSKWPEIEEMHGTTATKTIEALTKIFATHGFPVTLVSDNGPPFKSAEFENFLRSRGIFHRATPPYHPASNGQAESMVRTFKSFLKKQQSNGRSRAVAVCQFLARYRVTPCSSTGRAPAELLLGRMPRTKLSLLKPSVTQRLKGPGEYVYSREFLAGDSVLLRDLRPGSATKWRRATVTGRVGPLVYEVCIDGRTRTAHLDHLLADRTVGRTVADTVPRTVPDRPVPAAVPGPEPARTDYRSGEYLAYDRCASAGGASVPLPSEIETPGEAHRRRESGDSHRERSQRSSEDSGLWGAGEARVRPGNECQSEPVLRRSERLRNKFS
ncbi:uncharacterized protein K02A2.6-like isoform X1 [Amphibalanus amphitrite]|uniref:uncharacterized protein K02A2.6-like isoform X1 n=1 Tax=Amphibalanus amphitrite TaxID=1232801 RepID=UPI001C90AAE3|nr:uncharacterized protein K02A2.6-like isoform X1 [Amphibalanus amphitrite]